MKVGEPRKVVYLGAGAALAVGFLVLQFVGPRAGAGGAPAPQDAASATGAAEWPNQLLIDPFARVSHRLAASRASQNAPQAAIAPTSEDDLPLVPLVGELGSLPAVGREGAPAPAKAEAPAGEEPIRHSEEAPRTTVKVTAILGAERRAAYVSVNGGESVVVQVGDELAGGRVKAIEGNVVVWRGPKGDLRLTIAEEVEL